jgi:hypothetical protein
MLLLLTICCLACGGVKPAPALVFIPDELPEAQVGEPYSATIGVAGNRTPVGNLAVGEGALPPGLALHHEWGESSAEIRGTPETAGSYKFAISVGCLGTNEHGQSGRREYELSVRP